jgi:hypothetical protein
MAILYIAAALVSLSIILRLIRWALTVVLVALVVATSPGLGVSAPHLVHLL